MRFCPTVIATWAVFAATPFAVGAQRAVAPRAQWDGLPSVTQDYAAGRDAIKARVRLLVDPLRRATRKTEDRP